MQNLQSSPPAMFPFISSRVQLVQMPPEVGYRCSQENGRSLDIQLDYLCLGMTKKANQGHQLLLPVPLTRLAGT
ncbi:hypothetical protein ACVINW_003839 [Bradyrhizobium sp. USDA 4461]